MEFMTGIAVLMIIAMIAQVFIFERTARAWGVRTYAEGTDICNGVANTLNMAGYSEGSSVRFDIPNEVGGGPYNLTVYGSMVALDYSGHSCLQHFSALSLRYNGSYAPFNLTGGTYRVDNSAGVLTIEKLA